MLEVIAAQRRYQREKWGNEHDDTHYPQDWPLLLSVRVGRIADAALEGDMKTYKDQLIKLAAVAVAALETADRNS